MVNPDRIDSGGSRNEAAGRLKLEASHGKTKSNEFSHLSAHYPQQRSVGGHIDQR